MKITIIFYKSSSKYYENICLKCECFKDYAQENSKNILNLQIDEITNTLSKFKEIFNVVSNWTKTEYFINETEVSLNEINNIISIVECSNSCDRCMIKSEYCFKDTGWGCNMINSINLRKDYYYYHSGPYWYEFGHFEDGKWIINHDRIFEILQEEANKKHISICKYFNIERIRENVKKLPKEIIVTEDGEWQYKYRDAPVGMQQEEVIGVEPRNENRNKGYSGFSINLGQLMGVQEEKKEEKEKNIPDVTFESIGGIDEIIEQVREVIELPIIAPELFEYYHIKPHKGILLYGPPGCGKTLIAKAIANETGSHFIAVNGPEVLNKFIGESEANLRKIFKEAKELKPSIIYFDEFDAISATRDAELNPLNTSIVNQLLTLMDGIDENDKVCFIASTNRIDMIDEAIKRSGRFDYKIEIQKPNLNGCKAIFNIHTQNMPIDEKFDKDKFVEKYLVGYSGADISFVVTEAAYNSIRRTINIKELFNNMEFKINEDNIILEIDFLYAIKKLKDSKSKEESAKFRYYKT